MSPIRFGGGAAPRFSGVVVGGKLPYLTEHTTPNKAVVRVTGQQTVVKETDERAAPQGEGGYPEGVVVLNPAHLGARVVLCNGHVYADTTPPVWCRFASRVASASCAETGNQKPYCIAAGTVAIDADGIYAWADNGAVLEQFEAPDPGLPALAASAATAALVVLESAVGGTAAPTWLIKDAAMYAAGAGAHTGCDAAAAVVYGVGAAAALAAPQRLAADAAAAALAVSLAESVPVWAVGTGPAVVIELIMAMAVAAMAGRRGGVWALPWAAVVMERMVVASGTVSARATGHTAATAWLIVVSTTTIGFATIKPGRASWWSYFGVLAYTGE